MERAEEQAGPPPSARGIFRRRFRRLHADVGDFFPWWRRVLSGRHREASRFLLLLYFYFFLLYLYFIVELRRGECAEGKRPRGEHVVGRQGGDGEEVRDHPHSPLAQRTQWRQDAVQRVRDPVQEGGEEDESGDRFSRDDSVVEEAQSPRLQIPPHCHWCPHRLVLVRRGLCPCSCASSVYVNKYAEIALWQAEDLVLYGPGL